MTTGEFTSFPINSIYVDRAKRQRRIMTPEAITALASSISRIGLLHPPVIERTGELRVGETRWEACKTLGWTAIPVQFTDELDEAALQLMELEENIRRVDLPWQDQCLAVANYHALRKSEPDWTKTKTAEALGMTSAEVGQRLDVAGEILSGNTRVKDAPKYSTARGIVQRTNERKAAAAKTAVAVSAGVKPSAPERTVPLLHADFNQWVEDPSNHGAGFNLIHCDFPYGVNADQHHQGQAAAQGGYKDDFETYENLLASLSTAILRGVVADSAHLLFWFSMDYYSFTHHALEAMGWSVNPFPLIWMKNDNTGILPDPQRGPRRIYETCFLGSRGDRKLTARGAVSNAFAWPGKDKSIHMSEKPVPMLKHFMGMVCDEYSMVLDPTAGSGNALKAATTLGARTVLGLEALEEFYTRSKEAYYDTPGINL